MNNKQIWVFKEGRSGSTWFCRTLAEKLNRPTLHFERYYDLDYSDDGVETFRKNISNLKDSSILYATHYLNLLSYSDLLDPDTLLIRTTRRNKADHCMSKLAWQMFPTKSKHNFTDEQKNTKGFYDKPVTILKQQVKKVMETLKKHDDFWNMYAKNFHNIIVPYEDLHEGVNITGLDITIKFSDNTEFTKKLPYDKSQIFTNYAQIVEWCEQYRKELGFMEI